LIGDDSLFTKIDDIFSKWNTNRTPGCCLGIIRSGEFLYKKGYGMRNLADKEPITSETIFDIASVSKQFTAACIALLHLREKISINHSVSEYLPEVNFDPKIKIKHLIHHESGIKDYIYSHVMLNYSWEEIELLTTEKLFDFLKRLPELDFVPGSQHCYSNTNYFLLGQIVEKVTGKSLAKFAEQEFFSPLGMSNTSFQDSFETITNNKAIGYSPRENDFEVNVSKAKILGPRGVYTTVDDLFLWDQNFYSKSVGGKELIELLERPSKDKIVGLSTNRWNDVRQNQGYAFGLLTDYYRGLKIVRHGGDFAGYTSEMLRFPDKQITIIILTNCSNISPTTLAFNVADVLLTKEVDIQSPYNTGSFLPLQEEKTDSFLGTYYDSECNTLFSIRREDNKLIIENDWMKSELKTISEDTFAAVDNASLVHVKKKEKGILIETEFYSAEIPKINELKLKEKQLEEYSGHFTNEKFNQKLQISVFEDKLKFDLRVGKQFFKPIIQDTFTNGFLQLKFLRKNNSIFSACLNSSGSKEIIYRK